MKINTQNNNRNNDISLKKEKRELLYQSQKKIDEFLQHSCNAYATFKISYNFNFEIETSELLHANTAFGTFIKQTKGKSEEKSLSNLLHVFYDSLKIHIENALKNKTVEKTELFSLQLNKYYQVLIRAEDENVSLFFEDVTHLKTPEKDILLEKITTSVNDAIIVIDHTGSIILWNTAAYKIFGYTANEMLGKNPHNILATHKDQQKGNESLNNFIDRGFGALIGKNSEFEAKKKDGTIFPIELSLSALQLSNQFCSVAIIKDITERKEQEKMLKSAKEKAEDADKLKTSFLANMSHEIRTPVNSIIGFAELLKRPNLSAEKKEQFISTIHRNGLTLVGLIDDIIDISRIDAKQLHLNLSDCNIDVFMCDVYNFFSADIVNKGKSHIELKLVKDQTITTPIFINTDQFRLRQILSNMINNSIKFTEEGFIEISYGINENDYLKFCVKDSGIGMKDETKQKLFTRFFQADNTTTRKYGGNGLGLVITKGLVELFGGEIWIQSFIGMGTTVCCTIPYTLCKIR